jgi:LysM repeat protein
MNQRTPIIPPNSALGRPKTLGRSSVRLVVFVVLAFHLVLLVGLLIQGCKHSEPRVETASLPPTNALLTPPARLPVAPTLETNLPTWPAPPATQPGPPVVMEPPAPLSVAKTYSVVKGDSFYRIAHANSIPMSMLANANPGVDSAKLKVGQVLQLPQAAATTAATAPAAAAPPPRTTTPNHSSDIYVVKSGDTLAKIAKAHGTTVRAIHNHNRLKTDQILVGQKLRLPETGAATAFGSHNLSSQP